MMTSIGEWIRVVERIWKRGDHGAAILLYAQLILDIKERLID